MKTQIMSNFIPISRRLFRHQLWNEERQFSRFEAWIYLLKEARFENTKLYDRNKVVEVKRGQIYASVRFLSQAFGWSTKKTLNFIKLLQADGMVSKEIVAETGQMRLTICNYERYNTPDANTKHHEQHTRNTADTKSKTENTENTDVNSPHKLPSVEVDAETWRESFEVYLSELSEAYNKLLNDSDFVSDRQRFRPNIDVRLSLEKAYRDYWSTRRAWEKRRRSRSKHLDWEASFCNSLDQPMNQVYKQRNFTTNNATPTANATNANYSERM